MLSPWEARAPSGWANTLLNFRNSFYWDKKAVQLHGTNDLRKAHNYHWLHTYGGFNLSSGLPESEKAPLENRVWYSYYGQTATYNEGTNGIPKSVARVLDDGSEQVTTFEYNDQDA